MTSSRLGRDRLFAIGTLVVSLLLVTQSFRYPAESAQFPRFLSVLLLVLSAMLVIREMRAGSGAPPPAPGEQEPALASGRHSGLRGIAAGPEALVFASTGLYILAIQWVGFLAGSVAFMLACAAFLGNRRWLAMAAWGLLFPVALYLLFHSLLGVQLPSGWLI